MNKIRILFFIVGFIVLTGCNNTKDSNSSFKILGVDTKNIEKIEIIHGNIIIYPDFEQKDNLTLIEDFNAAFMNTGDLSENLDENLGIDLVDAEAYAQNDSENYYVYITFSNHQTLSLKNNTIKCDGILFDLNNMKMNWSKDSFFVGTINYANNTTNVEIEYSTFYNEIKNIFANLEN